MGKHRACAASPQHPPFPSLPAPAAALVKDLAKLESKDAIKLRSEAASIAAQVGTW